MKYESKDLEKWLRMHKRPFWEILQGEKKQGLFAYDEPDGNLESAVDALNEAIETLPNAEYKIRAKRNLKDPNNSYLTVDFVVNNSSSAKPSSRNQTSNMQELERLYQEKLRDALALKEKEFELKMLLDKFSTLEKKFDTLLNQVQEFQTEMYDLLDDGKVNGSRNNVIQDGLNNIVSNGTKAVVDRWAGLKS
ncbi:hypothetical protein [Arcicella lustrica]|uniref:Uncharacterized protein n=1 Tax=Arcicella lustrica TaxID=2984196 RepID=A0ABU5SHP0_9BACT|nr:hypothetical protein [Arcicella sp. DC25W]MEA5426807.1 hypothetical protein [Arcicella sp. DC25W]